MSVTLCRYRHPSSCGLLERIYSARLIRRGMRIGKAATNLSSIFGYPITVGQKYGHFAVYGNYLATSQMQPKDAPGFSP